MGGLVGRWAGIRRRPASNASVLDIEPPGVPKVVYPVLLSLDALAGENPPGEGVLAAKPVGVSGL